MITHQSVLVKEALAALSIIPNGIYIDTTFGQGGHSLEILKQLNNDGRLLGLDKDINASTYVNKFFEAEPRFKFYHRSFSAISEIAETEQLLGKVNGILFDLGTSATQLEEASRGFSFQKEGPLDMRMDTTEGSSAMDWVARASLEEMVTIFKTYGEERWAKPIARAIIQERTKESINNTRQLAEIIKKAHPRWPQKIHPATRTFQAIRIQVNQEIEELKAALQESVKCLVPGGRLAVITFHSLEARIVKSFVRDSELGKNIHWVERNIKPSLEEVSNNPRSRSAILRVMEKVL